jgi:hypothetical protein
VWFPFASQIQGQWPPSLNKMQVLLKKHMDNPQGAIESVFDFYSMEEKNYPAENANIMLNILAPRFGVVCTRKDLRDAHEHRFLRLTQQQFYLLDYLEEQQIAAIQGGAGTGKTLLAEEKARRLSETGKVLFLCYNSLLMNKLRKQNEDLFKSGKVEFHTITGLAKANTGSPIVVQGSKKETEKNISEYLSGCGNTWDFRHIVIDEGQDIFWEHILLLHELATKRDGSFYVF